MLAWCPRGGAVSSCLFSFACDSVTQAYIHPKNRRISIRKMDGDTAIIAIKWVLYFPIPFSYSLVDPPKAYRTGIAMFAAVCSFSLFSSRRTAASAIWGIGWIMAEQT